MLPLYSQEEIESVSCFERPPKKYGSNDRPWVSLMSSFMGSRPFNCDASCRCKRQALSYRHTDHMRCSNMRCVGPLLAFLEITAVRIVKHFGELHGMLSHLVS